VTVTLGIDRDRTNDRAARIAFSPDGNPVAFGELGGDDGAIYTALIGGDKALR